MKTLLITVLTFLALGASMPSWARADGQRTRERASSAKEGERRSKAETPEPDRAAEIVAIQERDESDGDWYGNVLGVIDRGEQWRIHYQNRGKRRVEYVDTKDFRHFTDAKVSPAPMGRFYFQDGATVYAYEDGGNQIDLYRADVDEPTRCSFLRTAYQWRVDGSVCMGIHDGQWMATGRVRGNSAREKGGWGDDGPPFPAAKDYPRVREAFENVKWLEADEMLKDRRGVSLHTSDDGVDWVSRRLAAPEDYDESPFAGWTRRDENGIGDFYASTLVDRRRLLVKVFKKEKNRLIDRGKANPDMKPARRFRFTGETIYLPAVIRNGEMIFTSTRSVIPLDRFLRKAHPDHDTATAPDREEVGQFTLANRVVELDGYTHLVFQYRDDVHYERLPGKQYSGIYVYRMPTREFEELFCQIRKHLSLLPALPARNHPCPPPARPRRTCPCDRAAATLMS